MSQSVINAAQITYNGMDDNVLQYSQGVKLALSQLNEALNANINVSNSDVAGKADKTTTITGTKSLTGGGDLSANRTLELVNDSAAPGNSKYYGTDGSGVRGWIASPSLTGYVSGPASSITDNFSSFADTTGKVLKDSGKKASDFTTANTAIVGATKTKITYDAKGLITSGADATTADISDSTNKRYVTDANITLLGNTSGTNSGDDSLATDSGLSLTSHVLAMGTPSTITASTTNAITTNTHTHAITGFQPTGTYVTSVGGTTPLTSTGGTTPTIACPNFTGDSGAGGVAGLVPAPSAGDAAAGKFIKADGTWAVPATSGGTVTSVTGTAPVASSGGTTPAISMAKATASVDGYLAQGDFATFYGKQAALTLGNLTETTSSILTITGGTGAIVGSGLTITVQAADTTHAGYLTSSDWNTFYGKQASLGFTPISNVLTSAQIIVGNASNVAAAVAMSGDASITNTGAVTVSKIGNVAIALGGAFTTSGAFTTTLTATGNTAVTLPVSGTLATTAQLPAGANPTASIGAAVVNGSASTFMRSDGAPPIGANAVTNALLAQMPANTVKINNTTGVANAIDGTVAQAHVLLDNNPIDFCPYRISLASGVFIHTADVLGATTIYAVPYGGGDKMWFYDTVNSVWVQYTVGELSLSISGYTASGLYDVFVYINGTTPTLITEAWTSAGAGTSARNKVLVYQDNVVVHTDHHNYRYIGTIMISGTTGVMNLCFGKTAATGGSLPRCPIWNMYNRREGSFTNMEATASWAYTTQAWRPTNGSANNKFMFVIGLSEDRIRGSYSTRVASSTLTGWLICFGLNRADNSPQVGEGLSIVYSQVVGSATCFANILPPIGYSYLMQLELSIASGTTTWYGGSAPSYTFSEFTHTY